MDGAMTVVTRQAAKWSGTFGRAYTDRNALTLEELDERYRSDFGVTRMELNERFLSTIDRSARILEVGSNIGLQLKCLQRMGFESLYGVELQTYAVELAKAKTSGINIIQGSAFDLPLRDRWFDVVFTSGLLIHIHPADLAGVMREIHRCSRRYIWGCEYWAPAVTEVEYRNERELLWKADYAQMYLHRFDDLKLVHSDDLAYADSDNVDQMFLLERECQEACA